ncbi:hypothetical protein H0A36_27300 [Endozoicomonas sp. SM1973]|uniref:Uncharacterized protein n=1 Tax=Spartinivicinus marinus TaxID=2994442 RepID=A0A853IPA9_9GAMM|nr:YaaC family protein [Spartinivicinus marinus]MCX4026434.1 YaaC family protein [Spartinivicinus marinus]NYZ69726.1 hypothetical protein [Spartinivicinus marinus]
MSETKDKTLKYEYNAVRFTFVQCDVCQARLLSSDAWSYLTYYLLSKAKESESNSHEADLPQWERAGYYADLAENFFIASKAVKLPAKATLIYYSMLNLVKCFLSTKGVELEKKTEHHGLKITDEGKAVKISQKKNDMVNIFAEFAEILETPVDSGEIQLLKLLRNIPEIHGLCCNLESDDDKSKLLPINISFMTNPDHNLMYTQISYQKEQENKAKTEKFYRGERKDYFRKIDDHSAEYSNSPKGIKEEGRITYISKKYEKYTKKSINTPYKKILGEYNQFKIVSILTRAEGYRYYVDLEPLNWHFLCTSLAAMFYLGSAARYRPHDIKEVMKGEMRPLITELVRISPTQFLYHLVSLITNRECVIPFSAVD